MVTPEFLKALASTEEIELTVTGRKSGKTSSRPVWFVHEPGKLYLLPVYGSDTSWYKNILANPSIQISARGKIFAGNSISVTKPREVDQVVEKFREKHGPDEITRYYAKLDVAVKIPM